MCVCVYERASPDAFEINNAQCFARHNDSPLNVLPLT